MIIRIRFVPSVCSAGIGRIGSAAQCDGVGDYDGGQYNAWISALSLYFMLFDNLACKWIYCYKSHIFFIDCIEHPKH